MISVVVVDDDFRVAKIHCSFLSRIDGFEVVGVAHTGAEALRVVSEVRPDLILLDLYLPDMFGLDLVNRLRVAGAQSDVMVISAANEFATVQQAVQLGVTSYLLKPFTIADLQQRLGEYLAARSEPHAVRLSDQSEVDRLFSRADEAPLERLPKGLSPETARLVMAALGSRSQPISALDCAEVVGISRVSARRYLEHFASVGVAQVSLRYGSGRPERRYGLVASVTDVVGERSRSRGQ